MALPCLTFCCGEGPVDRLTALFDEPSVLSDLMALRGAVSLGIRDFATKREGVVRRLNETGCR
jgi:hypothetical protein